MQKKVLTDIICGLLILLFLYTALSKLTGYIVFKKVLHQSPLIGPYSNLIAVGLPLTEICIAFLLFFPSTKRTGLYASCLLLTVFTLYLIYMLVYTPHLPCSCGGVLKHMSWKHHVLFNTGFILLSIAGIRMNRTKAVDKNISLSTTQPA